MSIELCVLASGSGGNCTVVRTPAGVVLIDIGIGPRVASQRLAGTGVRVGEVAAVCLTHLDRDHFNFNWIGTLVKYQVPVFCSVRRRDDLLRMTGCAEFARLVRTFDGFEFEPLPGLLAQPIALAHDDTGSHGFRLDGFGCRAGYATDLGRVPELLIEAFEGVDVLAIESNYDVTMQRNSQRPWFLVQRIMGGRGHLSNEQALDAVRRIITRSIATCGKLPGRVVLLHRSAECNCPDRLRELFGTDARIAPRLVLAEQHERTEWIRAVPETVFTGEQLALGWG